MTGGGCGGHRHTVAGCPECQRFSRLYERRRRQGIDAGTWRFNMPAATVQAHIDALVAAGMTLGGISRTSGISVKTVQDVKRRSYLHGTTAAAILAVRPEGRQGRSGEVSAFGVTRRVRALVALGWSFAAQGRELGVPTQMVWEFAWEKQRFVTKHTRERVHSMFERLSATPGGSTRAVNDARRRGWLPPLAWDDLDAVGAEPQFGGADSESVDEVAVERALAGEPIALTDAELMVALQAGVARQVPLSRLADQFGLSWSNAQTLLEGRLPRRRALQARVDAEVARIGHLHTTSSLASLLGVHFETVTRARARLAERGELVA